jgi:protein-S-isoprenylcysteine O-methyltransferase Ste14
MTPWRWIQTSFSLLLWPVLLALVGGSWRWPQAWIWSAWFIALCALAIGWLYRKDPALLDERFRKPGTGGQKTADRFITYGIGGGFLTWMILMPLDAKRYQWSPPFPLWLQAIGCALLVAAAFLIFRSFTDNPFLSPLVRVQKERKQHVVSTGVYGFVRHPMYLGALCLFFGTPLLLESLVGIGFGALMSILLMVRIVVEEKLLATELEGYEEYRKKVRYRLVPTIW